MKHFRWLRQAMPAWHAREREFRDWYVGIVVGYQRSAVSGQLSAKARNTSSEP